MHSSVFALPLNRHNSGGTTQVTRQVAPCFMELEMLRAYPDSGPVMAASNNAQHSSVLCTHARHVQFALMLFALV